MSEEEANKLVDKQAKEMKINWIKDSVILPFPEMGSYVAAQLRHFGRLQVRIDVIGTRAVAYDVDVKQQDVIKLAMQYFVRGMTKGREEYKK